MSGLPGQAPNATGTSGQSFVKGEFEELGWGAVPSPQHDLGTNLWLMARDENRFDLGALVGAQVKTGKSYFKSAKKDEESGEGVGWWYAEKDDSHFDYWSEHTTPLILVLRNTKSKTSYWVHVTSDAINSTGKANKILVPASQTVDESSRHALAAVRQVQPQEGLGTIDLAWLKSLEARCLVEPGHLEEARGLALEVQKLRAVAPNDPTAGALVAVTTTLVFDMSGFGMGNIGELIQSIDTSTRWWRSQTIASALEKLFCEQFKTWGRDSSITWVAADTVWTSLHSATLLAGLNAVHVGWRNAMSLLARRELMKATRPTARPCWSR